MKTELPHWEHLPPRIERLGELAYNFWWRWTESARALFRQVDRTLWRTTGHNPVAMLKRIPPESLARLARSQAFLKDYDRVMAELDRYLSSDEAWGAQTRPDLAGRPVAYLCAEFAIHNSLPIYSGGLGLLAGDICKEASDLALPMVGIGFYHPQGYFRQRIEADGSQSALYLKLDPTETASLEVLDDDGRRMVVPVPLGERHIQVGVRQVQVGRVPIYLLDTDLDSNPPEDRQLFNRLYIGDSYVRLQQEIILGIGGIKVLRAMGYRPARYHLNEGHVAFAGFELLREYVHEGNDFDQAMEKVRRRVAFTTHTPVIAGHDVFSTDLVEEALHGFWSEPGTDPRRYLPLGQDPNSGRFSMTILALRLAGHANGVSKKHGEVSRQMWNFLWPNKTAEEVPIVSITNGVHVPTWVAPEMDALFQRHISPDWLERHDDVAIWEAIENIPDAELWDTHQVLKRKMIHMIRQRARQSWAKDGATCRQILAFGTLLDPEPLTIGFARRFATYKRSNLILSDLERLKRLLNDVWRPVQIIFAGKAHPEDQPGQAVLREIFEVSASAEFQGRIAVVEEYDEHVAHYLVAGVDVWLNTPRPPLEASGTSGQKAALNGVPNCSVLDGWWCEGFQSKDGTAAGKNGWAVDEKTGGNDQETAQALYRILEEDIVPTYYARDAQGLPRRWIQTMKEAIRSAAPHFSARRMVKEYVENLYPPTTD